MSPAGSPRDFSLDVLRGWAIVLMLLSHIGFRSRLTTLAHFPVWISAAEPFVILAGFVLGMRAVKGGASDVPRRALRVYLIHVGLMFAVVIVHELTGRLQVPDVSAIGGLPSVLWMVPALRLQSLDFMNILPLFVVFFAAAPALVRAMNRGLTWMCLMASIALWAFAQRFPEAIRFTDPRCGPEAFVLPAWQLAFVLGLAGGYHRTSLAEFVTRRGRRLTWPWATLVIGCMIFAQLQRRSFERFGVQVPPEWSFVLAKENWGALRIPYVTGLMFFAYRIVDQLARDRGPLSRLLDALDALGKNSLYAFLIHLPLALLGAATHIGDWPAWAQEIAAATAIVFVYTMTKHGVGRRFVVG